MLKEIVTYEDYDGNQTSEALYFNLTRIELAENMHLRDEFEEMENTLQGEERKLTQKEIQQILEMVKTLMRLSYGVRSEDGKRFVKGEQIWTEFTQSAVYDTFLFSLFENPEKATSFMAGILPKELRDEALKAVESGAIEAYKPPVAPLPDTETPIREKNPKDMTLEELIAAMAERTRAS